MNQHKADHPYRRGPRRQPTPVTAAVALVNSVHRQVVDLIADELGVDETECGLSAQIVTDLGADSLDVVELSILLEEHFKLASEQLDEAIATWFEKDGTVGALVTLVERATKDAA